MSGHSKWSTIKRKKGTLDSRRGKLFTKLVKEITIAARQGLPDPDANPRLRLAIQNAKGASMPKDNIERAIKKGAGGDDANYQEINYEGYAPHGVALFVECLTDNLNRTVQNVRAIFSKHNGTLGTNGSLEFIFHRNGVFDVLQPERYSEDELILKLIDAGAEDIVIEEGCIHISCRLEHFGAVQKYLEEANLEIENSGLQRIPQSLVRLDNDALQIVMKVIEALEDDDDVQTVYHNIELQQAQLSLM